MGKKNSSPAGLGALYERVCGLDVHKKVIVASLRILDPRAGTVHITRRQFGTMTATDLGSKNKPIRGSDTKFPPVNQSR